MRIKSPTGVSQIVRFDESVSKIEWNDSFSTTSWTEETTVLRSAVGEETSKEPDLRSRLELIQDRLQRLEERKQEDVQENKLRLRQAKFVCKEILETQYPVLRGQNKPTVKDVLVKDCSKIIRYLREQNATLRPQINFFKKGMKELKVSNQDLQEANRLASEALEGMEDHVEGQEAVNAKLTENIELFSGHLPTMKNECSRRQAHYQREVNAVRAYEQAICKIIARVKERRKDQLVEKLIEDILQGHTEASEARITNLANAGMSFVASDGSSNLMEQVFGAPVKDESRSIWSSSSSSSSSSESDDASDSDSEE